MHWKLYDVVMRTPASTCRRRLGLPVVGERMKGYVVVAVIPVEERMDHVTAIVVVERWPLNPAFGYVAPVP